MTALLWAALVTLLIGVWRTRNQNWGPSGKDMPMNRWLGISAGLFAIAIVVAAIN